MQHHLPDRSLTEQHGAFLNERVTSLSRFRHVLAKVHPDAIEQLDYPRERQVYLLTNGKRTIGQIASLLSMHPVDVAFIMKQLLEMEYVECISLEEEAGT